MELLDFLLLGRDTDVSDTTVDRHVVKTGILDAKVSRKQVMVKVDNGVCSIVAVRA